MSPILSTFSKDKVFLPVIHPISKKTAMESISSAVNAEADGIFLINQGMEGSEVIRLATEVKNKYPNLWVGINLLGYYADEIFSSLNENINGLWNDNAQIIETSETQPNAKYFDELRSKSGWKGLYFGGIAFKGQRHVPFSLLSKASKIATRYMDVVTTSGYATGEAAEIEKIKEMKSGMPDHTLGIASGITVDNVYDYLPYVDAFLVATGIESSFGVLDPVLTKKLSKIIHDYR